MFTYDWNIIKELVEHTFNREGSLYLALTEKCALTLRNNKTYLCSCQNVYDLAFNCIDKLKLFQIWLIVVLFLLQICFCPVIRETSCCLFYYYYHADVIVAFNSISRYLNDLFNIDNLYFELMVSKMIFPDHTHLLFSVK